MSLRVGDLLWTGDVLPSTREICSIRQGSCFNKYPAKVSHPPPTRTMTCLLCSILMKRIFSPTRYLPCESLSTQNLFGHLQGGSSEILFTASSSKFPVLFFPEDFDEDGEGEGAESVSSCSISFSNFIKAGGSTPYLAAIRPSSSKQRHTSLGCLWRTFSC